MKIARTMLAWCLCLMFVSSGLQGVVLCISSDGSVDVKLGEATVKEHCAEGHTDDRAVALAESCSHACVDIAISGVTISEFTLSKETFSRDCTSACMIFDSTDCILAVLECDSAPPYRVSYMTTSPDRTIVLRI